MLRAILSASTPALMSILDDIKSEEKLWNHPQSVTFLVVPRVGSNMIQYVEYFW
jgi:hypothetical protein